MKLLRQLGMSIDTIRSFQQGSAGFALVLAELAARLPARLTAQAIQRCLAGYPR